MTRYASQKNATIEVKVPWSYQYTELKLRTILVLIIKEVFATTRYYITDDHTRINEIYTFTIVSKILWFLITPICFVYLVLQHGTNHACKDIKKSTKELFTENLSWWNRDDKENEKVFEKVIKLNHL